MKLTWIIFCYLVGRNTGHYFVGRLEMILLNAYQIWRWWYRLECRGIWIFDIDAGWRIHLFDYKHTKFHIIIPDLHVELLTNACDIILKRPADVYTQLKKSWIEQFSVTHQYKIMHVAPWYAKFCKWRCCRWSFTHNVDGEAEEVFKPYTMGVLHTSL